MKRMGDLGENIDAHIVLAAFYPGHVPAEKAGKIGYLLLGKAAVLPDVCNTLPDGLAGGMELLGGHKA